MKKELFRFLKNQTSDVDTINRLIVSSYLYANKIYEVNNNLVKALIIQEDDKEYQTLLKIRERFEFSVLEDVIEAFEFVISPEDKVVSGAVYTPDTIRKFIVDEVFSGLENSSDLTVCDPACGCSGFLLTAVEWFRSSTKKSFKEIIEQNIYGVDVKNYAVERSKILLTLLAISNGEDERDIDYNFHSENSLSTEWRVGLKNFGDFDIVIGNPPYVCSRNIDEGSKLLLANWGVSSSGHPDLYIPFFEIGISLLKENGRLGYITMNSFFKSLNGRALRKYFSENRFKFRIIDFGDKQIFQSNSTYTCICFLGKEESSHVAFTSSSLKDMRKVKYVNLPYAALDNHNGWNLKVSKVVNAIESVGRPFASVYKTSSGIATLKNDVYIFDALYEDDNYLYLDESTPIEKGICQKILNSNRLTKITCLDEIKRDVIFPYEYKENTPKIFSEEHLQEYFPMAYRYLLSKKELLSTRDKGNGDYDAWYAYGRKQSLEKYKYKLFFPHIASNSPNFIISSEESLLFHNGLCLLDNDLSKIKIAQKIMSSRLFWFYIQNTSKPYGSGFMSLSKNYIKSFGVADFSEAETGWLVGEADKVKIDEFLEKKYKIRL